MWNTPTKERLAKIPRFNETDGTPLKNKIIHLHFFIFESDWFVAEYNGDDLFFGYVILNGDIENAEWGLISFSELRSININGIEIDCELEEYWEIRAASAVDKIRT